jgi:hypothetical protein
MISPILNVSSLLLGLTAWGFAIAGLKRRRMSLTSFALCLLALVFQFAELTHRAQIGDTIAILDTVSAVTMAAAVLSAGTLLLNTLAFLRGKA